MTTRVTPELASSFSTGVTALLDALPDATAVLGPDGTIVAVNKAWRLFALDNGGLPETTGVGVNYLDVCQAATASGCADSEEVRRGLLAVLSGATVECVLEYPCPSPSVGRWFALRATPIPGPQRGALVAHMNVSRRKLAELDLERRASQDPLTGLPNRAQFTDRLNAALRPRVAQPARPDVGLLYIDLDGFKPVNDTFGHAAGDEVLQEVASRMRRQVRPQDTLARIGGDEFALVAPRISAAGLTALMARLQNCLAEPHLIHGQQTRVGASIGAYLASHGEDGVDALHRADQAMYAAKRGVA